jgi:hypothetical protein
VSVVGQRRFFARGERVQRTDMSGSGPTTLYPTETGKLVTRADEDGRRLITEYAIRGNNERAFKITHKARVVERKRMVPKGVLLRKVGSLGGVACACFCVVRASEYCFCLSLSVCVCVFNQLSASVRQTGWPAALLGDADSLHTANSPVRASA